ncbi:DNA methyltransferase [Natranaeroarchaeum aerophilus]|uniref:site-specific DNA-methyltransferase (cytosine-N(4)-specific) n=1 Tax=Natranaeroarchaeum aerophilus TaxID=2917711 RepID=A0AAE3K4C1_9EURY|nr:DNA methyltransferase [Natranaeroarchaeum aerophilus]MCL9812515.1 DNA adenine methylase [Natranaeroarchaeum aerophilus]
MSKSSEDKELSEENVVAETTEDLQSTWKDAHRNWGHSLHRLAPYIGGFPPSLAHYFIRRFSKSGDTVLDPFSGGGTTPLEAALQNRNGYANDAFSYAYVLSKAKCNPLSTSEFEPYLDTKLDEARKVDNEEMRLLDNDDLKVFYSDHTLDQILRLREVLHEDDSRKATYLNGIMCGILHGPSKMYLSLQTKDTYSGTANYVRKYAKKNDLQRPERDIRPKALRKQELAHEDTVPASLGERTKITRGDSRNLLNSFEKESVDLIVTSPPYMQTLDYTWNNWIRLWWLNEDRKSERNKLDITEDTDKYRRFMRECLHSMYDVLAPDSVAVLIVGDVQKNLASGKRTLNTAAIIAEEARNRTDFDVHGIISDAYDLDSRAYVVFNRLKYDHEEDRKEKDAIDRCLILTKGDPDMQSDPDIDWETESYTGLEQNQ